MITRKLCMLAAAVFFGGAQAHGSLIASGTIAGSDGTMVATQGVLSTWDNPVVNWSIDLTGNTYTYTYVFDSGNDDGSAFLSHLTVETSSNFTEDDLLNGTTPDYELGPDGASPENNDGSGPIFGVKWQADSNTFTAVIVTLRQPVWGDIFLKNGSVSASNSGYIASDPIGPVVGLDITGYAWLGVPDTFIPTPGCLALIAIAALVTKRRRR